MAIDTGTLLMEHQLELLLKHAELNILEFDINQRTEMQTFKRNVPYYIMSYHKQGTARLRIDGHTHTITPGTVICIPPNVEHDHYKLTPEETIFLWWHFTFEIADVVDVMKMFSIPLMFKLQDSERFETVFEQFIASTAQTKHLPATILRQAKAWELLYIILDSAIAQNGGSASPEQKLIHIPSQNFLSILSQIIQYPEQQLSLQDLADELHLHPTYISNRFKEIFGKSPMQMERELRVQRAKTLLETTELTVTEIAHKLGYTEVQNFTRLFTSYVGVSPSQFRNLNVRWRKTK